MSTNTSISPRKKAILAVMELAKTDPQIAAMQPDLAVRDRVLAPNQSLIGAMEAVFDAYSARPALGSRDYQITQDSTGLLRRDYLPHYSTISYAEFQTRIKALANAWIKHPQHAVHPNEMVCIMGFNGSDFATLDYACMYAQAVTVPLQSATSGGDLNDIFATVEPVTVASTIEDLLLCTELAIQQKSVRSVIVFDYEPNDDHERRLLANATQLITDSKRELTIISLAELIDFGQQSDWQPRPASPEGGDRMTAIIHSSGSTGTPKGAVISEKAVKAGWVALPKPIPVMVLHIAPLNHLLGRGSITAALRVGGSAYFTVKPDLSTLFEDIRLVRPIYMVFFPRILELIYQNFQSEVARRVRLGEGDESDLSTLVMKEMRHSYLGDRLKSAVVAGAPTARNVSQFMQECFDIALINMYGNTESGTGTVAIDGVIQRPPVTEYKLRDVPELGYYSTDKPYPRGELIFKTTVGITQYYKQPEATAGLFDDEGFSCTGDIVEEHEPDRIVIIDRVKDVLKLSQGEYVAVGSLGTKFEAGSAVIKQIYIYGNSLQSYLLAVIVPDEPVVNSELGDGYTQSQLKNLLRDELQSVAKLEQLKSFEVPRDFIIETEPFSQENGLLSSVRKRLRPALNRKYGAILEAMYESQEDAQEEELKALKQAQDRPVMERLTRLLELQLKTEGIDPSQARNFTELGGDSLASVGFSVAIEEIFGVSLPADAILKPTGNLAEWAKRIEGALSGDGNRPTFNTVHGKNARSVSIQDLALEHFINADSLAPATKPDSQPNTVFLTGANGFLGRFVCLQWLEILAARGGSLICLIRATDNAQARARLDQVFAQQEPSMASRYQELAEEHLRVIAGDASEERLGLSPVAFKGLAESVDRICHVAALVNHRLSYANLFGPNVVGTAELIKLALSAKQKAFDFVSTEAVQMYLEPSAANDENAPLRERIELSNRYASGYAASKWAGEHLLQKAHSDYGLNVNVFRGDMMLAHQTLVGQINASDMFTRLLFSVVETGLAPHSFYQLQADGERAQAHYDGTPVDIVAEAVCGAAQAIALRNRVFNVSNYHHDDGCSLDTFVDCIEAQGYPINRIADHKDWFARFSDRLNSLPEAQRRQSAIDILTAFSQPHPAYRTEVGCDNFKQLLKTLDIELPHLDMRYIEKCLNDLRYLGLIESPKN